MSSEVVKKRGRPKKVISDPVEIELPEAITKPKARTKTTKAAPKTAKASTIATTKPPTNTKASNKSIPGSSVSTKSKPTPPPAPPAKSEVSQPATPIHISTATTPPSTISEQVRELSSQKGNETFPTKTEPLGKTSSTMPPKSTPATSTKPASESSAPTTDAAKSSSAPQSAKPASPTRVPLAEMNSEIVSRLSTRAGARPNAAGSKKLPANYQSVARRFTATIVAIPIALVTSWVLYQRLVDDPKNLMRPVLAKSEDSGKEDSS